MDRGLVILPSQHANQDRRKAISITLLVPFSMRSLMNVFTSSLLSTSFNSSALCASLFINSSAPGRKVPHSLFKLVITCMNDLSNLTPSIDLVLAHNGFVPIWQGLSENLAQDEREKPEGVVCRGCSCLVMIIR